ncbi:hypothetical protein CDD82_4545 [Ophiocordyceps australis]|uniref:C2 domain-containing protein n=1 Tax=Ophiocordyceps australis TaxID=1399860 RepID=A0A2C5Z5S4_9HYPO|nr:hypothetical protein CDD82_4545 [Ophiocordyceps australis]
MSTASRQSWQPSRRLNNLSRDSGKARAPSWARSTHAVVDHDEARSLALGTAYLHYLVQPRAKRKHYVPAPRQPAARSHTSIGQLLQEYVSGSSSSLKLPHSFAGQLLDSIAGVCRGVEALPGYNDTAVKRSFAEAYTAFSEKSFRRSMDKERKFEPLVLIFYSAATKAAQKGRVGEDDSWKTLPDRHLALFVRLSAKVLRASGHDRDRPELMSRLTSLENKLLTNDQNLVHDGPEGAGTTVEVRVPLSHDVKDMPMVQTVAAIFGQSLSDVQADIRAQANVWTEEAALRDLKTYQHRLNSDQPGALRSHDFQNMDAFNEWKKSEAPHLSHMMLDILTARPELAKMPTAAPSRPQSLYSEEPMSAVSDGAVSLDAALSSLSLDTSSGAEAMYTFIPRDARAFYKYILQLAMTFDQLHAPAGMDKQPLSPQSMELMTQLCVCWRIPQSSRLVAFVQVAAAKFLDGEMVATELDAMFDFVKSGLPEPKKAPPMSQHSTALMELDPMQWPIHDANAYVKTLRTLHETLLRELYDLMGHCYDSKPPDMAAVRYLLENHVGNDPAFVPDAAAEADFSEHLEQALREKAADVYRQHMEREIPARRQDWEFGHVVRLGKAVAKLCEGIRKRFRKTPVIMGVSPLQVLVAEALPSLEKDAGAMVEMVMSDAADNKTDIDLDDGFELYRELVQIRRLHRDVLPQVPFAFNVEELLMGFVWRFIRAAEQRMGGFVAGAIKQDAFEVRGGGPERHSVSVMDLFMLLNQTVDQVFALEWDNGEHHAMFMTALARVVAAGIGRYCDVVEQRFAREMDRPAAQQDGAAPRTRHDTWVQMAREAWSSRDKAEPFHFYGESLVKLNNIEYAMQELDKLDKRMDSEACARLLEQVQGAPSKTRRPATYTFTIKVVEAEDVKACDPSGYSDPYVVFGDEYQKRLHKTRIAYRTLNPRWDESFDMTVQGAVNVIATIWDHDTFGDHDYVGRTSLKLDPAHFGDYLPREFWLDLDSQGRLLVRVSMEGERDDMQFHFGKAFRHLKRTERDMVRTITDKLTAHIKATLSHDTLRSLLGLGPMGGIGASVSSLWKKRASTPAQVDDALTPLLAYFDDNFAMMKQTLTDATMTAVMTRLWKEVLMTIEKLLVPPLSDKASLQRPLSRRELDIVYHWLDMLFAFFNARDQDSGEQLGVPAEVLKSPKWHDLASINFFYFEDTPSLIRESERMASTAAHQAQQTLQNRMSAPASLGPSLPFATMGTIRRGKSIMMTRNLGTMRLAKEAKRREAQAEASDDMILRILRMRPEAAHYLKERHRQKERQAATAAAALIVRNSVMQGWNATKNNAVARR